VATAAIASSSAAPIAFSFAAFAFSNAAANAFAFASSSWTLPQRGV
jgi:hypothetical protein